MKITEQLLSTWGACGDGKRTFTQKFPEGAEYAAVIAACDDEGHQDYRDWIFNRAFQHLEAKEIVEAEKARIPVVVEQGLKILDEQELKDTDSISKESEARLAASGDDSRLAASGNRSRLAASGDDSRLAASGDDSQLAASGYYSRLAASGENSIVASAGLGSTFKLGKSGCAAIPYRDGNGKVRFANAYVDENIEADTWYRVNAKGEFIKVEG